MPDGRPAVAIEGVSGLLPVEHAPAGERLTAAIRPEHLILGAQEEAIEPGLAATVEDAAHLGPVIAYRLRTQDGRLLLATAPTGRGRLNQSDTVWVRFDPGALRLLAD